MMETVEINKHSVVFCLPKPAFLSWVKEVAKSDKFGRPAEHIYPANNTTGWLIPRTDTFGSTPQLQEHLNRLKPHFLRTEVRSVFEGEAHFPSEYTAEAFDAYFELKIAPSLVDAKVLSSDLR